MRDYIFLLHSKSQYSNFCFSKMKFTLVKFIIRVRRQWHIIRKNIKVCSKETKPFTRSRVSKQIRIYYEYNSTYILFGAKLELCPFMHIPVFKLPLTVRLSWNPWMNFNLQTSQDQTQWYLLSEDAKVQILRFIYPLISDQNIWEPSESKSLT